jgi:hypothetical protein
MPEPGPGSMNPAAYARFGRMNPAPLDDFEHRIDLQRKERMVRQRCDAAVLLAAVPAANPAAHVAVSSKRCFCVLSSRCTCAKCDHSCFVHGWSLNSRSRCDRQEADRLLDRRAVHPSALRGAEVLCSIRKPTSDAVRLSGRPYRRRTGVAVARSGWRLPPPRLEMRSVFTP